MQQTRMVYHGQCGQAGERCVDRKKACECRHRCHKPRQNQAVKPAENWFPTTCQWYMLTRNHAAAANAASSAAKQQASPPRRSQLTLTQNLSSIYIVQRTMTSETNATRLCKTSKTRHDAEAVPKPNPSNPTRPHRLHRTSRCRRRGRRRPSARP